MHREPSFIRRISEAEKMDASRERVPWQRVVILCAIISIVIHICLPRLSTILLDVSCTIDIFAPLCPDSLRAARLNIPDPPVPFPNRRRLSQEHRAGLTYIEEPLPIDPWLDAERSDRDKWGVVRKLDEEADEECRRPDPVKEREALAALTQARANRYNGNHKRAAVIIEHALALLPTHPDILTEYGRHLEHTSRIVEAEGYYARALSYNPQHAEALECRARTEPIVSALDEEMLYEIREKRNRFASLPRSSTLRRAMRESYFSHIYHTVAIEGNTLTLGETRSILESGMPVPGKSIREHNEVLGMDSALRFLNRSLIHLADITLEDILEMHHRVLGHAQPMDAGRLRDTQVYVGRFTPVAPQFVREQMLELVEWLNDPATSEIDPVQRAAIAHYKLVVVHPFVDGNGRTARLLLNLILMKAGFPPIILPVSARAEYYATLHTANLGDLRPFVRFVAQHVDTTLQSYINLVSTCEGGNCGDEQAEIEGTRVRNLS